MSRNPLISAAGRRRWARMSRPERERFIERVAESARQSRFDTHGRERQLTLGEQHFQRLPCGCPIDSGCDGSHVIGPNHE